MNLLNSCSNGYLSAYLRGQTDQADLIICGSSLVPPLVSSNPRLLLVFNSLQSQYSGHGFKAKFHFLTGFSNGWNAKQKHSEFLLLKILFFFKIILFLADYAIPGTPATEASKCHFIYRSTSALHGTFNSPRHPSNYPDEANCIYEFLGLQSEQIRITFETFKLENSLQTPRWELKFLCDWFSKQIVFNMSAAAGTMFRSTMFFKRHTVEIHLSHLRPLRLASIRARICWLAFTVEKYCLVLSYRRRKPHQSKSFSSPTAKAWTQGSRPSTNS